MENKPYQRYSLRQKSKHLQPLDRLALLVMIGLSVIIGLILLSGDTTSPRVRDFSWQDKQISAQDRTFIFTFSRPMDTKSVEKNLQIDPPLAGKFSWAGRRMAYTLLSPAPYGNNYQVKLSEARERFPQATTAGNQMQPFVGNFRSRDRAFVYLGIEGEEKGQLILYNLTQQEKRPLTPKDLLVVDFEPYPNGDRILFSARNRLANQQNATRQQLYTVTTGIHPEDPEAEDITPQPAGKIDLVLDSEKYQNLQFHLSQDGKKIIVQRVNHRNPGSDFGLWLIESGQPPQRLETQPGGDFLITPDNETFAIAQGQGIALLPIEPKPEPVAFFPQYGKVFGFAEDNSVAAMLKFNTDYTRSLFLVPNQGTQEQQQEILRTKGSVLSCQFAPLSTKLYCLLTTVKSEDDLYIEEPYIAAINLETSELTPLVVLPNQRDVQISLSPDGLALLFDQVVVQNQPGRNFFPEDSLSTNEGQTISTSHLWLLPLPTPGEPFPTQIQPIELPLEGLRPHWLP